MKIITTIGDMREYSREAKRSGKTIGFVPTMGYLHDGHMSLVREACKECDIAILSIFVNPVQFGPGEDFERYPRDMEKDTYLAEKEGVSVIFAPSKEEMYPKGYVTYVETASSLTEILCGLSRPGHFRGVATIVAKLFDIVTPNKAYFGQKDAQQAVIIKRLASDLNMSIDVRILPTVRETDGIAMSSRNTYLSKKERPQAQALFSSLKRAEEMIANGEKTTDRIKEEMAGILQKGKDVRIDYIEVVDADNLERLEFAGNNTLIAVAAFVGGTRLIDNVVIKL